jgi:hypothetical protein
MYLVLYTPLLIFDQEQVAGEMVSRDLQALRTSHQVILQYRFISCLNNKIVVVTMAVLT